MKKNDNLALVLAFITTAGLSIGGIWVLNQMAPGLLPFATAGKQSGRSGVPQTVTQLTVLGDTFSGYSTFRHAAFQTALGEAGIGLRYEDEFDQAKRADRLNQGQADLLVTTLDQFLKHKPQGKIVGLIDRTIGADAVVLNTKKYPTLKSLLDLTQLVQQARQQGQPLSIAFAGDTPSEYLALVLDTKFEAFNLADFQIMRVSDASEAWRLMQDPNQSVAIAVIWEPYVTQARQQGYTVVLSSQDAPKAIVDVIVASDRTLQQHPTVITTLLENYYRRIDANVRDASQLQTQIAEDGKLSRSEAAAVLQGIDFFTAIETQSWMTRNQPSPSLLDGRIQATAAVLVLAGQLNQVPANPSALYTGQYVAKAAQNTQVLVDLVRADNPELADRLAGKQAAIATPNVVKASQVKAAPAIGNLQVRGTVGFGEGSVQLTAQSQQTLNKLAQEIGEFSPQTVAVRVIGHTSRTGTAAFNQALSQQRAQVVVNHLRHQGVKNSIVAEGKGFDEPLPGVAPNHAQNQRTEIRLVRLN